MDSVTSSDEKGVIDAAFGSFLLYAGITRGDTCSPKELDLKKAAKAAEILGASQQGWDVLAICAELLIDRYSIDSGSDEEIGQILACFDLLLHSGLSLRPDQVLLRNGRISPADLVPNKEAFEVRMPADVEDWVDTMISELRPTPRNVVAMAFVEEGDLWLDAVTRVYCEDSPVFQQGIRDGLMQVMAGAANEPASLLLAAMSKPHERGWLDAEIGSKLLTTRCTWTDPSQVVDAEAFAKLPRGTVTFGEVIARLSRVERKAAAWIQHLAMIGVDLNQPLTRRESVLNLRRAHVNEAIGDPPATWTGTLLHIAVEALDPHLVAQLLQLGCDPTRRATSAATWGTFSSYDCMEWIALSQENAAERGPFEPPELRERRAAVEAMLRS